MPFFQGKADFQEKFPRVRNWCTCEKVKIAFPNDILMSVRAPVGSVNVCNQRSIIGRGISAIRPFEETHGEYLYYFLKSNKEKITSLGTGSTFKAITQQTLAKIQIPFPPINDQIRIAMLLSRVETLIATRKNNLRLLDEFLKSTFLEMFGDPVSNEKGWQFTEIQNVCIEIVDCVNKTAPQVDEETPYLMIRTSNIKNGKISLKNVNYVSKETFKIWTRRSIPQKGDILLTREAPMGEAAIIDFDQSVFLGQRIMQYRVKPDEMNALYLLHLMRTRYFANQIEKLGRGSTVKHLSVPDCFKFFIPLPPTDLQTQFATIVEKTESLKNHYQQNLSELENMYHALSQKAFKGELDLSRVPLAQSNQDTDN
jgi:type I restriction enzyme S subunit